MVLIYITRVGIERDIERAVSGRVRVEAFTVDDDNDYRTPVELSSKHKACIC